MNCLINGLEMFSEIIFKTQTKFLNHIQVSLKLMSIQKRLTTVFSCTKKTISKELYTKRTQNKSQLKELCEI